MSSRDVDVTYERDVDNRIVRAGAMWRETSPGLEQMLVTIGTASLFAVVAGMIWLLAAKQMNSLLGYGLAGLIGAPCLLFALPGRPRGVYFHADGRMETPFGIYYRASLPAIGGHYDNVASIEARMQREQVETWEKMFEVILISKGGDLIVISRDLHEDIALKAATQLTRALEKMRKNGGDFEDARVEVA